MGSELFYHKGKPILKLGFGFMRLPLLPDGTIDLPQVEQMVDTYLERGFCYFDTAFGYHKQRSEIAMRKTLVERHPRNSYLLATKLPAWKHHVKSAADAKAMFELQMERLRCGWIDYYLFQNMGEERTEAFDRYGLWDYVAERKAQGLIRHFGISFHDKAEHLDRLLDAHPEIEFVQLQINYADWESPVVEARKCHAVAKAHGKPIVVMEPVKGGVLTAMPDQAQRILDQSSVRQSNAAWALRYAASQENVRLVLSGMSDMAQMRENTDLFSHIEPMGPEEKRTIECVQNVLAQIDQIACTSCGYCCEECPGNVKIPKIMTALNFQKIYNNTHMAEHYYFSNVFLQGKAGDCLKCGACEHACPQRLPIRRLLQEAVGLFGE